MWLLPTGKGVTTWEGGPLYYTLQIILWRAHGSFTVTVTGPFKPWSLCQCDLFYWHRQGSYLVGRTSTESACSTSLGYILPYQISICPRTTQPSTLTVWPPSSCCTNSERLSSFSTLPIGSQLSALIPWLQFHACTDTTVPWWSPFGCHCNRLNHLGRGSNPVLLTFKVKWVTYTTDHADGNDMIICTDWFCNL